MVRINDKACEHGGCTKIASYGYPGEKSIYCYRHSVDGTIQLRRKRCTHPSCPKSANYGHGGKAATCCRQHATDGMTGPDGKRVSPTASLTPATPPGPSAKAPTLAAAPLPAAVVRGSAIVGRASALFAAHYSGLGAEGGAPPAPSGTVAGEAAAAVDVAPVVAEAGPPAAVAPGLPPPLLLLLWMWLLSPKLPPLLLLPRLRGRGVRRGTLWPLLAHMVK